MAHAFGTASSGPVVAGAIVTYFFGLGFVTGWLATYLFLTPAVVRMEKAATVLVEQSGALSVKVEARPNSKEIFRKLIAYV